jgi:hypothetical protein
LSVVVLPEPEAEQRHEFARMDFEVQIGKRDHAAESRPRRKSEPRSTLHPRRSCRKGVALEKANNAMTGMIEIIAAAVRGPHSRQPRYVDRHWQRPRAFRRVHRDRDDKIVHANVSKREGRDQSGPDSGSTTFHSACRRE